MALYGYARVSTTDQECTLQEQALRATGLAGGGGLRRRAQAPSRGRRVLVLRCRGADLEPLLLGLALDLIEAQIEEGGGLRHGQTAGRQTRERIGLGRRIEPLPQGRALVGPVLMAALLR